MTSMTSPLETLPRALFAASDFWGGWLPQRWWFHAVVVAIAAVLLWQGVLWVERWRGWRAQNARTPKALFRELCRAHRLSRADRQLLTAAAEEGAPRQFCRVFIDGRVLAQYASRHPADAEACRYLVRVLFDG